MSSFDEHDDLKDLRGLKREAEPPRELEERVVAALRERELIASAPSAGGAGGRSYWAVAAAVVIAALGGWVARGVMGTVPTPSDAGRPGGSRNATLPLPSRPRIVRLP